MLPALGVGTRTSWSYEPVLGDPQLLTSVARGRLIRVRDRLDGG
jgi:hypothetical protein